MLKLTIKPGEFINIGEDIRVVYKEKEGKEASRFISPYYAESKLSPDTLTKIRRLIKEDKMANKDNTQN